MRLRAIGAAAAAALGLVAAPSAAAVPPGSTVLVDVPSALGQPPFDGNGEARNARHSLSQDGCLVVFTSDADDLLVTDDDAAGNIYRHNRCTPGTPPVQVNTTAAGVPATAGTSSFGPTISADGRYVAFTTTAGNLDPSAAGVEQVLVKDMQTGALELASRGTGSAGAPADTARGGVISGDGTAVVFIARGVLDGSNVDGVANQSDAYVRFLGTDVTTMASVTVGGLRGGASGRADIDYLARNVAFVSEGKLDPGDNHPGGDAYLRHGIGLVGEGTRLVSSTGGGQGSTGALDVATDGSVVAYTNGSVWVSDCLNACVAATAVDKPLPGGSFAVNAFASFFPQNGAAPPTQIFWHTHAKLDPADTNGFADVYRAPLAAGPVSRVSAGFAAGDVFSSDSTENGVVVFSAAAPDLAGTGGSTTQAFERVGGQTRNLVEVAGVTARANDAGEGDVGRLHAVSDDGRMVVFTTDASAFGAPLRADGTARVTQLVARDVATGATTLVSAGLDGSPQSVASTSDRHEGSIDAAGTRVVFPSKAPNLVAGVADGQEHIFMRDLRTGVTTLVDRAPGGAPATYAEAGQISGDGTKAVFLSSAPNLPGASPSTTHVYEVDFASGTVTLVDRAPNGDPADGSAFEADVDFDGSRIAFASSATNLGGGAGTNVYVRDLEAGTTTLASIPAGPGFDYREPALSRDGARVAFTESSSATPDRVYVRDLAQGITMPASTTAGVDEDVSTPSLNADGTRVAFRQGMGVYMRGLAEAGQTRVDLRNGLGTPGRNGAFMVSLSGNGSCAAFVSRSDDLTTPAYGPDLSHVFLRAIDGECAPVPAPAQPPGGPSASRDTTAPTIAAARVTPKRFALGARKTPRAAGAGKRAPSRRGVKQRAPRGGTTFVFKLSEAARTTITIAQPRPGARRGKRCVKPRRGLKKRCTRYVTVVKLTRARTKQGVNRVAFTGRVGRTSLRRGSYRATLVARDAAGNASKPKRLTFTVVGPKRR